MLKNLKFTDGSTLSFAEKESSVCYYWILYNFLALLCRFYPTKSGKRFKKFILIFQFSVAIFSGSIIP